MSLLFGDGISSRFIDLDSLPVGLADLRTTVCFSSLKSSVASILSWESCSFSEYTSILGSILKVFSVLLVSSCISLRSSLIDLGDSCDIVYSSS